MAYNRKWYVIWSSRGNSVFDSWEECKAMMEKYPDAHCKSFANQEDAIIAYRGNPDKEMGILRSIAKAKVHKINYAAFPDIIVDSIAVDAACSGNPGVMEYQGVDVRTGERIFHGGPFPEGTNNIGEYLAIVHALAMLKKQGKDTVIYSDSVSALAWVRNHKSKSKLVENTKNAELMAILRRADEWMSQNTFTNRIMKWDTGEWGEIPADFGRK
jgi:ribonuclease HI